MKKISKKIVVSVTAAAFLSLAGAGVWAYAAPYSYVSLDVNPSIEYTLNMFDRVIDVEAVNDDGQAILEDAGELKNLTIEDAIAKTVDELTEEGYLPATTSVTAATDVTETGSGSAVGNDDTTEAQQDGVSTTTVSEGAATETGTTVEATNETGTTTETTAGAATDTTTTTGNDAAAGTTDTTTTNTTTDTTANTGNNTDDIVVGGIVITVSNKDIELTDELVGKIRDAVEDVISQEVEVDVMGVGYARVQEARKLGVTPGKLNLVEKLKASSSDPDSIVISEWVNKPVKEIMRATKENKKAQTFSTSIQSDETSESANSDTAADAISGSEAALNTDDSNKAAEVNQNSGNIVDADDQDKDDNEDADDQGEDENEDADDQGEDDNEDDKEIRKEAIKAVKKAEKDAKKEAMEAAKEDSKSSREASREAKKKADEAAREAKKLADEVAREAKKLAKEAAKEANEQIREAAEEEREAAEKVREASENDREDAEDEDNDGGNDKKDNYGSMRSAEKRNNQNGNGKR